MGWYYDGRGNPSSETRARQQAIKRSCQKLMMLHRQQQAEQNRRERKAASKMRELAKLQKQQEKMKELERAAYEVQVFENRIDCLLSVHKECGEEWDWLLIHNSNPPSEPQRSSENEVAAQLQVDQFKPDLLDKLFGRVEQKRADLAKAVEEGKRLDSLNYQNLFYKHLEEYESWQYLVSLSKKVISGDVQSYIDIIDCEKSFDDISELGSLIEFDVLSSSTMGVVVHVNSEKVIPSEIKSLTKAGKLSVKKMPKAKFFDLYQDYVCSCALRMARELFALLPIEKILLTCIGELFDSATGNIEEQPILSVVFLREIFQSLNFDELDPSDSIANFPYKMRFQKTKGFLPIQSFQLSEIKALNE
ncbi:MAG: hypothetical protein SFW36_19665 [Leptolyngbyaceae cyanobacterium bins.59]|nr:hypothetical protein [Leptolyngbyaceae cyanobacterium bins.59]